MNYLEMSVSQLRDEEAVLLKEYEADQIRLFATMALKGLIYKGKRMVNWCSNCGTAISDAEVEFEEEAGHLWYINYFTRCLIFTPIPL